MYTISRKRCRADLSLSRINFDPLNPTDQLLNYYLYGDLLPTRASFSYLGVPFCPGGCLNAFELLTNNINKSLATMNQLAMIGLNPNGLSRLLATRFYKQIVRSQLEYGLAISKVSSLLLDKLEDAQNTCLHRIFGGSCRSSIKVMLQLTKLPTMAEHDTLLIYLFPHIRLSTSHSQWYTISKMPLWKRCAQYTDILDKQLLKKTRLQYLYNTTRCLRHTSQLLTKQHAIYCLDMHHRLQIPKSIADHLSLLLNKLPTRNHAPVKQDRFGLSKGP
ncbi:hypothetical protein BCV72DRAFT_323117 [Rhizopus microsporus var. microsporus]|uniref:Uncharacterized protein n=1 Tax=Rhizopus microsporus var. microsporus TaxID=86635 RepID=A0A1X0QMV8_RHIZD|nr:hypothetical protein BCV72DRAFT_323117 [Rhizopus microsporus var. microsporus]